MQKLKVILEYISLVILDIKAFLHIFHMRAFSRRTSDLRFAFP
jgi:hypothetical protein